MILKTKKGMLKDLERIETEIEDLIVEWNSVRGNGIRANWKRSSLMRQIRTKRQIVVNLRTYLGLDVEDDEEIEDQD